MTLLEDILKAFACSSYETYVDRTESTVALNLDLFDADGEYKDSHTIMFKDVEGLSSKDVDSVVSKFKQVENNLKGLICPIEVYVVSYISYDMQENPVPCVFDKFYRTRKEAEETIKEFRKDTLSTAAARNKNTSKVLELSDNMISVQFNTVDVAKHSEFLIKRVKLI